MDFDEFFATEHDPLVRLCWGVTTDRELAQDIAQETMCRAFERWPSLIADGSNPAAWCRTVALNLVRSNWRRTRTADSATLAVVTVHHDEASSDPELVAALRALAPRQREAVVLHHLLDLDVARCAAAMEISESSVKAHLQRGRASLEVALGDYVRTEA